MVTIQVVREAGGVADAMDRAFGWFDEIEERCSRFRPHSELMRLGAQPGVPFAASAILFEAVRFALMVAEESGGAFDPTVGGRMAARGFNREHRSGEAVGNGAAGDGASYRDVEIDAERRTITLRRPLTLDLGAVAKGLAVDAAARELGAFGDFAIDAGGDLYLAGCNPQGAPWSVGIRNPRAGEELIARLRVSGGAVCTSGDYERPAVEAGPDGGEHHILDPRTGASPRSVASATVLAPGAMLADAVATAVFVLGPEEGIGLLDRLGLEGLIVTPELQRFETAGICHVAQD